MLPAWPQRYRRARAGVPPVRIRGRRGRGLVEHDPDPVGPGPVAATRYRHRVLDPADFSLQPITGGFTGEVPPRWCFGDRAFGGYTAALALGALLSSHPAPCCLASVTFLEGGVAGPIEIEVERLRSGRTATAARATVSQGGLPILLASAWLADGWSSPPAATVDETDDAPGPGDASPVTWLTDEWPVLRFAERAGVDYPTSWVGFARGRPEISIWARMLAEPDGAPEPLPFAQMADVLHLDAHLFDAPGQVTGWIEADLLSLDLSIAWRPGGPPGPVDRVAPRPQPWVGGGRGRHRRGLGARTRPHDPGDGVLAGPPAPDARTALTAPAAEPVACPEGFRARRGGSAATRSRRRGRPRCRARWDRTCGCPRSGRGCHPSSRAGPRPPRRAPRACSRAR